MLVEVGNRNIVGEDSRKNENREEPHDLDPFLCAFWERRTNGGDRRFGASCYYTRTAPPMMPSSGSSQPSSQPLAGRLLIPDCPERIKRAEIDRAV